MSDLVRSELAGLGSYLLDRTPCRIKLDQNESPWDFPRRAKRRVLEAMEATSWAVYPDLRSDELRQALGEHTGWDPEGILVGNGSNELLELALAGLVPPGGEVLGATPSFGLYPMLVLRGGGRPAFLPPRSDLALPSEEIAAELRRSPRRMVLLCSPNNPTGAALRPAEVERLLQLVDGPFVLDNAYGELCRHDYRPLLDRYRNLVLLRTFSKAWGLAALRIGYLLAHPEVVRELGKAHLPYNLNRFSTLTALEALAEPDLVRRRIRVLVGRRAQWGELFERHGLEVLPSEANFLLVRHPEGRAGARAFRQRLLEGGVRVRDVGAYPGLVGCMRVTVGDGPALRAVTAILDGGS